MDAPVGPCRSFENHYAKISPSDDIPSLYVHPYRCAFYFATDDSGATDFIVIPLVFYIVVAAGGFDLGVLRNDGWLFDIGSTGNEHWYQFYSYLGTSIYLAYFVRRCVDPCSSSP